jgi:hypothetical protein
MMTVDQLRGMNRLCLWLLLRNIAWMLGESSQGCNSGSEHLRFRKVLDEVWMGQDAQVSLS